MWKSPKSNIIHTWYNLKDKKFYKDFDCFHQAIAFVIKLKGNKKVFEGQPNPKILTGTNILTGIIKILP